jgi:hypothetical protein
VTHHIFRSFEGLLGAVLAQAGNRALLLATQGFREGWIRRGGVLQRSEVAWLGWMWYFLGENFEVAI